MKKLKIVVAILLSFITLVSCASGNSTEYHPNEGENTGGNGSALEPDNQLVIDSSRKVIYNVQYTIRSSNVEETIKSINSNLITLGGYISRSNDSSNYYATYVYKIPTDKLNDFLNTIDSNEGITNKSISTEDVTSTYNKIQASIETYEASKAAYEKMLAELENPSINDIIQITSHLDDINSNLKYLYAELDSLNGQVDYATVTIDYYQYDSQQSSFLGDYPDYLASLGLGFVSFLAYSAPFIIIAAIACLIIFLIRKNNKSKKISKQ